MKNVENVLFLNCTMVIVLNINILDEVYVIVRSIVFHTVLFGILLDILRSSKVDDAVVL